MQEARRQAAAEAANRRLQHSEQRGVDEDELRRMKQRQIGRDHLEEQNKRLSTQPGGLRVRQFNPFFFIFQSFSHLVANELVDLPCVCVNCPYSCNLEVMICIVLFLDES